MPRTILHLDLDAFFCAVEELHQPALRGQAFAVGGQPDERGVVASCSYPARRFGVHSAMPMSQAVRRCPGLIIVPARHGVYGKVSSQVMARLRDVTPQVEQMSIDEAYLDVSGLPEPGEVIARRLQARINTELDLPCSLGVATNKLVAKIANNLGKAARRSETQSAGPPNAVTVVPAGQEAAFLAPLPIHSLFGVGPKTAERLEQMGVRTIGDLARWPPTDLQRRFGKAGLEMSQHALGIDERPLETSHPLRSISQENTFARDVSDPQALRAELRELSEGVGRKLRAEKLVSATIKLKLRWPDFTTLTRQVTFETPLDQDQEIYQAAVQLFESVWKPGQAVRLLGVGAGGLSQPARQLSLWDVAETPAQASEKDRRLQAAIDTLRQRFGDKILQRGKG